MSDATHETRSAGSRTGCPRCGGREGNVLTRRENPFRHRFLIRKARRCAVCGVVYVPESGWFGKVIVCLFVCVGVVFIMRELVVPCAAALLGFAARSPVDFLVMLFGLFAIDGAYRIMKDTLRPPVAGGSEDA